MPGINSRSDLCSSFRLSADRRSSISHVLVKMKLKLDLHDIYSDGRMLEDALRGIMDDARRTKAKQAEIIPGKGSGQLKKHVLRFLEKNYKGSYQRIEKDDKNWGRIFVWFRWE